MNFSDYFPEQIKNLPAFDGQFEAYKLAAENCNVLFGSYPAGTVIEAHSHESDNVGVLTRGKLKLTMDGETREINAGEWYHVPAGKLHAAEFPEDTADIEFWFTV